MPFSGQPLSLKSRGVTDLISVIWNAAGILFGQNGGDTSPKLVSLHFFH